MDNARKANGQFGAGNRANPRGRPRKSASLIDEVARELRAKVTITENGKRRRVSKLAANTKQIVNQGASGEIKAAKMALDFAMRAQKEAEPVIEAPPLSRSDREIVERFLARLRLTELTQAAAETTEPEPSETPSSPTSEENPDADA